MTFAAGESRPRCPSSPPRPSHRHRRRCLTCWTIQRHHLASDASLLSNSTHADLLQVRRTSLSASLFRPQFAITLLLCPCDAPGARGSFGGACALPGGPGESPPSARGICILGMARSSEHVWFGAVGGVRGGRGDGGGVPCCRRHRIRQKTQLLPTRSASLTLPHLQVLSFL